MNDLLVVAPSFGPPDRVRLLRLSCEAYSLPLLTYGDGEPWPGFVKGKMERLLATLQLRQDKHILFTDGYDSFITQPVPSILDRFNEMDCRLAISAETNCWPDDELSCEYPQQCPSPWKFLNAGGFMGKREAVMSALERARRLAGDRDDDQLAWTKFYLSWEMDIRLDRWCKLFQTMGTAHASRITNDGFNTITDSRPCVWHFNGRVPGIEQWHERLVRR